MMLLSYVAIVSPLQNILVLFAGTSKVGTPPSKINSFLVLMRYNADRFQITNQKTHIPTIAIMNFVKVFDMALWF